ncbi:hypothetical protein GP475_03095 [Corynebacterium poyangense]|uniref:Uncharacterized protein n=1 Tax=Corynebacterium poyangense TaxID=2684405 RepID=A0A7H0SMH1_9CORY|nr:hypothetical protein [Corynebacterium poyangense]QNQ89746.1 hypothetical protein GP475_03095 [Corynebacterium poyangense]
MSKDNDFVVNSPDPSHHSSERRAKLKADTLLGFVGTFAVLSLIQAVVNVCQPEPRIWPAILALVLVISTVAIWRWRSQRFN